MAGGWTCLPALKETPLTVSSVFVCLLTDLKGARHNGTPKPLRAEHKGQRGRARIKPREEGKEDKRGGGGGGGPEEGERILARRQASSRAFG